MGHSQTARSQSYLAHSANSIGVPHRLKDHLVSVAALAKQRADGFPWADEAALAGLLHDLGKYGDRFQARLRGEESGLDHWSTGAWVALKHKCAAAALAIQGHHIGLQYLDRVALGKLKPDLLAACHPLQLRLTAPDAQTLESRFAADGLALSQVAYPILDKELVATIPTMLDVRMLFSALVDADFLDTEAHFNGGPDGKRYREPGPELHPDRALQILLTHIEELERRSNSDLKVLNVRRELREACRKAAESDLGLFTLTAPTGSGKTLAMLAFAMKHAVAHGLRRVVMVIPYLTIIEQTANIYRALFKERFGEDYVLEHHSLAGTGKENYKQDNEGQEGDISCAERRCRLLAENWDAPVIVTTSVQLLQSLFSNRPAACRKLHRLQRAVILFDEVQTLPNSLAIPTLATLSHLAETYGSSVVFATATQPAFGHLDAVVRETKSPGWRPSEIVPQPRLLFAPMRRTVMEWGDPRVPIQWPPLAEELREPWLCGSK